MQYIVYTGQAEQRNDAERISGECREYANSDSPDDYL